MRDGAVFLFFRPWRGKRFLGPSARRNPGTLRECRKEAKGFGMPLLLAIESSTPRASLVLQEGDSVIFEAGFESERNHNAMLFEPLEAAIAALGEKTLDWVVIGTGPGSYSGTRVGIAAGQGVAMIHGCPAIGLSSLMATQVTTGIAIGDARRGSAWWAEIGTGLPLPQLIPAGELAVRLSAATTVFSFEDIAKLELPEQIEVLREIPTARALARAWSTLTAAEKEQLKVLPPQPAYLRPPHITPAKHGHPLLRKRRK